MDAQLMNEMGIRSPTESAAQATDTGAGQSGNGITDINQMVMQVFGDAKPDQSAQPAAQADPSKADPSQQQQPPAPGQQPPAQSAQPAAKVETDPAKVFAESSPKAFFTPTGELDSAKINDYYLTNGKSFMKFADTGTQEAEPTKSPTETTDPMKEYNDQLNYMAEHLGEEIANRKQAGATDEQIVSELVSYYSNARGELKKRQDIRKAIEESTKNLAPELEAARRDRIKASVDRNIAELSAGVEGLVPGLTGYQILNQFLLDPKYGGAEVDRMFMRDNPGANAMKPEDRNAAAKKWFGEFQQDRKAMAHVAEFGRLRWMVENFKPILEHAQKVGAQKVANQGEAGVGSPSKITNQPSQGQKNALDAWFGVDSVN